MTAMKIAFTNDHAGSPAREKLLAKLRDLGHEPGLPYPGPAADHCDAR